MHERQREQTHELFMSRNVQRALLSDPATVTWLTGVWTSLWLPHTAFTAGPMLLWYDRGAFTLLVLDAWGEHVATFGAQPGCTVVTYTGYTVDTPIAAPEHLARALRQIVRDSGRGAGLLGLEERSLPAYLRECVLNASDNAQPVAAVDDWLLPLRALKTPEEIQKLRENFALTDIGHAAALSAIREGVTELELWATVYTAVQQASGQAQPVLLGNDCTVGRRAHLGGPPADIPVLADDSFVLDLGTSFLGYRGDSCATYYAQDPSREQAARHRTVAEALELAISLVRPGVRASAIDRQTRQFIADAGYPVYPHHTGHGIGVTSHEAPRITPYNDEPLLEGMVIMLEPAIYLPGESAVRLEDALLVTPNGAERLTTYNKALP